MGQGSQRNPGARQALRSTGAASVGAATSRAARTRSCKGLGVCPSCNARRLAATAAPLTDHVFPRLPVRQWVLSVPKWLRFFVRRDADLRAAGLCRLLRVVEQRRCVICLRRNFTPPAIPNETEPWRMTVPAQFGR